MKYNLEETSHWIYRYTIFDKLIKSKIFDNQYHFVNLHKFEFNFIYFTRNL